MVKREFFMLCPVKLCFLDNEVATIEPPTQAQIESVMKEFEAEDISGHSFEDALTMLEDD